MPKTHSDVIKEYTNLIETKLDLLASEPYRVWTDSAENRAKEAQYTKWYEFHYGLANYQGQDGPKVSEKTGEVYYRMFTVAMLMKAPSSDVGFGLGLDGLKSLGSGYNGPTHLAVMCSFDAFLTLMGRELAGAISDGTTSPPRAHAQRLKTLWRMLRHVETVAVWQHQRTETWFAWPEASTEIILGARWAGLEEVAVRRTLEANSPHNVRGRTYRAAPQRDEFNIDEGTFPQDEKKKLVREENAKRKQLAQFRDA